MNNLVSTQWLAANCDDPGLIVVDASWHLPAAGRDAAAEFVSGHIPGARFLDLAGLIDLQSDVPQALPQPGQLADALAQLGVSGDSAVVLYDDSAVKTSARAWYLCRAHGLENIAILDGGLAKWKAEGRPLEVGEAQPISVQELELHPPSSIRFKADMIANIESEAAQVLDARDAGRFSGTFVDTVHNMPSGHIPGSCNLPFVQVFAKDGTYRSPAELRALVIQAGIDPERPIIASCGSGVTACVLLFALDLIGAADTALYDGSWLDWGSDPSTPKATTAGQSA